MSHFKKKKEGKACAAPGISHTSEQYIKPQLKTSPTVGRVEEELVNAHPNKSQNVRRGQ